MAPFARTLRALPLACWLLLLAPATQAAEVLVAVAANFTDATRALATAFERHTGHRLRASFASTGTLYAQIVHGAPYEVFLAADQRRPQLAEQQGWAVRDSRFTYARGKLVLWSPEPGRVDDGERYLASLTDGHLAIANPQTAPYGSAAQQALTRLQLWPTLQSRLVRGDSIAQTFQFVATGNAEAGLVAQAQVQNWPGPQGSLWPIPPELYQPIVQQAVLLHRGQDNPAATAWMAFLRSEPARAIIRQHGYDAGPEDGSQP